MYSDVESHREIVSIHLLQSIMPNRFSVQTSLLNGDSSPPDAQCVSKCISDIDLNSDYKNKMDDNAVSAVPGADPCCH